MKTWYWLVKREFWEHRGGFLWAPIISGGVIVVLTLMSIVVGEVFRSRAGIDVDGSNAHDLMQLINSDKLDLVGRILDAYIASPGFLILTVMFVVVLFYCLSTLSEDRRDRSVLFWKSLPISERETVLAKVFCAGVLVPAIAIAVSVATGLLLLLVLSITASFHGANLWHMLWTAPHPLRIAATMIGAIPLYLVWALPAIGWLLLCSALVRSRNFLLAIALPVGSGIVVTWLNALGGIGIDTGWYWSNIVGRALLSIFPFSWKIEQFTNIFRGGHGGLQADAALGLDYTQLWSAPFVIGAIVGVVLILAAIWLRRWRADV